MIVCLCKGVNDREIRSAIRQGSATVREVGQRVHAGTDCGMCRADIRGLIERERGGAGSGGNPSAK